MSDIVNIDLQTVHGNKTLSHQINIRICTFCSLKSLY